MDSNSGIIDKTTDDSFPSLPPLDESAGRKILLDYLAKKKTRKNTYNPQLFQCTGEPVIFQYFYLCWKNKIIFIKCFIPFR